MILFQIIQYGVIKGDDNMKMITEEEVRGSYFKEYDLEYTTNVKDYINELINNGISVDKIQILENVELEQQSIDGQEFPLDYFMKYYAILSKMGTDTLYKIFCQYNELPIKFMIENETSKVLLITPSKDVDLENIINQKKS